MTEADKIILKQSVECPRCKYHFYVRQGFQVKPTYSSATNVDE